MVEYISGEGSDGYDREYTVNLKDPRLRTDPYRVIGEWETMFSEVQQPKFAKALRAFQVRKDYPGAVIAMRQLFRIRDSGKGVDLDSAVMEYLEEHPIRKVSDPEMEQFEDAHPAVGGDQNLGGRRKKAEDGFLTAAELLLANVQRARSHMDSFDIKQLNEGAQLFASINKKISI